MLAPIVTIPLCIVAFQSTHHGLMLAPVIGQLSLA
jgi:hypothetical protein